MLRAYLDDEIAPTLARLGFTCRVLDNPGGPPALVAERMEHPASSRCWSTATATLSPARTRSGGRD